MHFPFPILFMCMNAQCTQLSSTLHDPMDCSSPGSTVHGILQARILEWVAMPSSRGSSQPRDRTHASCGSCAEEPLWKPLLNDSILIHSVVIQKHFVVYLGLWGGGGRIYKAWKVHSFPFSFVLIIRYFWSSNRFRHWGHKSSKYPSNSYLLRWFKCQNSSKINILLMKSSSNQINILC